VFRFHVLRAENSFCRYRGRRVPFSCFALADTFSAVRRALGYDFIFCEPELVFGSTKGVGPRFHVLRAGLVFGGNESAGCRFHVLRSRNHFPRYRGRRVSFSCFALLESVPAVPRASGLVFKFCAPELFFGGTTSIGSRFHVLRTRTRFQRYGGHEVPFLAVPRASSPIFMFCAPGLVSHGTEGVRSLFHGTGGCTEGIRSHLLVLRPLTRFRGYGGR
jgi:hypothetical protein